jgi:hypothetical protein
MPQDRRPFWKRICAAPNPIQKKANTSLTPISPALMILLPNAVFSGAFARSANASAGTHSWVPSRPARELAPVW